MPKPSGSASATPVNPWWSMKESWMQLMPKLKARLDEKQVEIRGRRDRSAEALTASCRPRRRTGEQNTWTTFFPSKPFLPWMRPSHISTATTRAIPRPLSQTITAMPSSFLDEIDAAAVYVNASTRFTDGFEFGFGAEIGISTQKLHARGPMGLLALTTTKYIIYGNGQIRK